MSTTSATSIDEPTNRTATLRDGVGFYLELAKARLATLVVLTAVVGYVLAARGAFEWITFAWTVTGTTLTAFGANILNQWLEADRDRLMERTRNRPLPAGHVSRATALIWGLASSLVGLVILDLGTNRLTAALSLFVIVLYVGVYTPLKVRTPLNTVVGAVCGAVPPMMGWTAATGQLELGAWILGGILFIWQVPHFLALAWMYREDYARGGFRMMPAADPDGSLTGRAAFVYALALLPVTGALAAAGVTGMTYLVASQIAGLAFASLGFAFARRRVRLTARRLFFASIIYLPVLLGLMVTDMDDRIAGAVAGAETPAVRQALARPSHQLPAAGGDAQRPAGLSRLRVLDVPSSTTPRPENRKPHWTLHFAALATKPGEKVGLQVPGAPR